ncbi:acyltransferase [Methylopila jiangsuensis]|uniref:Acyltransferase n=1 Tax=Methylopila jiangsuensis TaxID=586230 RepID=A0A9W6N2L8_9HYPH|nr:acyltransferase [Methylopila jiangsuensis]MDR6285613.1 peptidoglycan/LPS O-acetylase OafA/YrhL [Methylopila jiangsuensis]GLK75373.1 acyltransferase [Methylopila jiangsuensis]
MRTLASQLSDRENNLSAVRIVAAALVMLSHSWLATVPGIQTRDFFHIFGFSLGHHGVHVFFILSGLLLTWSMLRKPDPLRSMVARVVRYFPAIIVSCLIMTLVVGALVTRLPASGYYGSGQTWGFLASVIGLANVNATLPGVYENNVYPGILYVPLWTLHYELAFSLTLSILVATGAILRKGLVLAGLAVTLAIYTAWFWDGESHANLGSVHHLVRLGTAFGVGVAMAVFADRIPVSWKGFAILAPLCAVFAYSHFAALAGIILLSYLILCVGFTRNAVVGFLATLGTWSYGLYVSSFVIEQTVTHLAPHWPNWAISISSFAVAVTVGAISWRYVEKPCLRYINPITDRVHGLAARLVGAEPPAPRGRRAKAPAAPRAAE